MKASHVITLALSLAGVGALEGQSKPPGTLKVLPPGIPLVIPALPPRSLPAVGLLPEGSNLKGVLIPRYNSERELEASLRAELMTVVTREEIEALGVNLKLFATSGTESGQMAMQRATYNHASGLIRASERVQVSTPKMHAAGSGLIVQMSRESGGTNSPFEGFLLGPVQTTFYTDRRTSMNRPASLRSLAIVCLALTDPALAAGPVHLKPEEMKALDQLIEQVPAPNHAGDTARILSAGEERAQATQASMKAFAKRNAMLIENRTPAAPAPAPAAVAAEAPTEAAKPGITVQSDGDMYFDAATNVIVYTKNIRLDEARFKLACDDQLQIFLKSEPKKADVKLGAQGENTPAPPEAKPDEQNNPQAPKKLEAKADGGMLGLGGAGISGIERIIATGNVKVTSTDPQGNSIVASAETAVYEAATGAFILKGGLPQIQRGPSYQRALEPGVYIRYNSQDGNFEMSEGKKETFFVLPDKKTEKNK